MHWLKKKTMRGFHYCAHRSIKIKEKKNKIQALLDETICIEAETDTIVPNYC
jgi:hypothetical protein